MMACYVSPQSQSDGQEAHHKVGSESTTELIHPHELAEELHSDNRYVFLDCQPLSAYNTCHITGAVHVAAMMKKQFMSGKIGLYDLVPTVKGRERFTICINWPVM